ncbi:MAG TPA: trehalose-phosphatase, partial [Polyangiaceae bacterium]
VEQLAHEIKHALTMPLDEQKKRMKPLRARVFENDVNAWRESFLSALDRATSQSITKISALVPPKKVVDEIATSARFGLSLDYDGTLVPFAKVPSLAAPDPELLGLLGQLAERQGAHVQIVSGRAHEELERWFGGFSIELFAEHGLWWREKPGSEWKLTGRLDTTWQASILPILEDIARRTSGSSIEKKSNSLAWHYRTCEPEIAARRVFELKKKLALVLPDLGLQALDGSRVLEVRARGVGKMIAAKRLAEALPQGSPLVAIGDDVTDEDLFGAMPEGSVTIHVGGGPSVAKYRLEDPLAVRAFLRALVAVRQ